MKKEVLIVDGYNMIGAWPMLEKLKNQDEMEEARDLLLHELSNYAKYEDVEVRVVFDAQFVPGIQKSYAKYQLSVIFTKEGETADSYIERVVGEENLLITQVTVATSDLAEQWIIFQKGALRKSANELFKDLQHSKKSIENDAKTLHGQNYRRNSPWNHLQLDTLERFRDELAKKK
ncbi:NYN domain-containing protein [Desemzia sp. RIT804]|uniref:NYN domain-containing protein n=1 Tax=Desemzia sp. RIT 804 TaxID=2810209 RepID=UPI0019512DAC|nr:NYN domain-containing protein [Desemzia sp. RIT 804]MBM6615183.1 NYN domain-containing protein [Desemzia sp. RIT 804]